MKIRRKPSAKRIVLMSAFGLLLLVFLYDIKRWVIRGAYFYRTYIENRSTIEIGKTSIGINYPWFIVKSDSLSVHLSSVPPTRSAFCGLVTVSSRPNRTLLIKSDARYECTDGFRGLLGKSYEVMSCRKLDDRERNMEFWFLRGLDLHVDNTWMPEICRPQFLALLETIMIADKKE